MKIVPVSSLEVSNLEGELVIDSRLIATRLGIGHDVLFRTINKYLAELQRFGHLRFQNGTVTNSVGATNTVKFAYLNENQSALLMTMSRNTKQVVQCKIDLVSAFSAAKQIISTVIPAQSERIQELQMELEIERLKTQREARQDTRIALHGLATTLLLEGKSDAVIEIEKPVLEVIDQRNNTSYKGQTLTQIKDFLLKKHGLKYKTGADIKRVLEQKGMSHLVAQTPRSILSDYVPSENQQAVYDALVGIPVRQMLLGE
jgi:anti-repressor protein